MARARLLKPSFFTNDELAQIPPLGRLLFAGLWCLADREGRLDDRPARIGAEVLPYDRLSGEEVHVLLGQLESGGFIQRYAAAGKRYIQVIAFPRHQNPHHREPASIIPAPDQPQAGLGPALGQPQARPGLGTAQPGGIRYTVYGNQLPVTGEDPPTGDHARGRATTPAEAPSRAKRKREITDDDIGRWQLAHPHLDIPAFVADYRNWTGSAKHGDKVLGFENQLRVSWKCDQFTRPECRKDRRENGYQPGTHPVGARPGVLAAGSKYGNVAAEA